MAKPVIGRKAQLTPVASPTDTFVRIAEPQRSSLWGLADALGKFDSDLQPFLTKKRKEDEDAQIAKAQRDHYLGNPEGTAEGVRRGLIPAYVSPAYQAERARLKGDAMGNNFAGDFQGAYLLWDGKDSDDPQAFDKFLDGYAKKWLGDVQDPAVLKGLMPNFIPTVEGVRKQYQQDRAVRYYQSGVTAATASVASMIDKKRIDGMVPTIGDKPNEVGAPTGTDYEGIWQEAMIRRQRAIAVGMKGEDFDKQLYATIAAKAIEHKDADLFSLLDKEMPGTKIKFSDTPEGLKLKMETEATLLGMAEKDEREGNQKRNAQLEAAYKSNMNQVLKIFATDPNAVIPEDVIDEMAKHDGDVRKKIADARSAMNNANVKQVSPEVMAEIYEDLVRGGGTDRVLKAIADGTIAGDPKAIAELSGFAERFASSGGKGRVDANFKRPQVQLEMNSLRDATKPNALTGDATTIILGADAGWSEAGLEMSRDVRKMVAMFAANNPNATTEEMEDFTLAAIARVKRGFNDGTNENAPAGYTPPKEALEANPNDPGRQEAAGAAAKGAEQKAKAEQDAAADNDPWVRVAPEKIGQAKWNDEAPPVLTSLPKKQQDLILSISKEKGWPPEYVISQMWGAIKMKKQGGTTQDGVGQTEQQNIEGQQGTEDLPGGLNRDEITNSIDQSVGLPEGTTGGVLDAIQQGGTTRTMVTGQDQGAGIADDTERLNVATGGRFGGGARQAATLLKAIRAKEAPRGYGQVYGGVPARFKNVDVTKMTLNEVLDWQRQVVRAGSKSSAAGGYQFIHKTLLATMQRMGLKGDEVWTPELQDRMAVNLLEERGLNAYLSGRMSRTTFANNLAKEWASLPVVSGKKRGRSYYAGDGLNKSFHDPEDILALVDGLLTGANAPSNVALNDPPLDQSDDFVSKG